MNRAAQKAISPAAADGRRALAEENALLRAEIRVARRAAELTANLVVKQFEQTEKVLHRFQVANAQRKAVLDSATQISIVATDRQGIITVFNTGAENLLGYQAGEVIGRHTPELFHLPGELELVSDSLSYRYGRRVTGLEVFFEYAAREQHAQSEWTYVRKDGTQFPVRTTINALRDPEGAISGLLFIAMDIAEAKRSEKALRESERKYRLLVRNLPNCVYRGYLDGSIDFFDDKIEQITGYPKEEFLTRRMKWFDLVHEEDMPLAQEKFRQALRTDNSYIREYRVKSKTGKKVWIQDGGQIIYGENGEVEFITGTFIDITERKLAEEALHESEEKYRSLFDSGPDPIFVLDRASLEILDANPVAEETYGYSRQELVGMRFSELGPVEEIQACMADAGAESGRRACIVSARVRHYRKGGRPFFVRVKACPARFRQREVVILATSDITEVLEKEAQLLQASKMTSLGEMSAGIAHELNQPLNVIRMGSEYLKMMVEAGKPIAGPTLAEVCGQIMGQVDRASGIIQRLREFGRKPDFDRQRVCLNRPVRIACGILEQQLRLADIQLDVELDEELPPIMAHATSLEQVVFNLLGNARDAVLKRRAAGMAVAQPAISVRTFAEQGQVVLTVADRGTGMPREVLERVFEPFFTTKEVGSGMGLGLSISYGIVRNYDGRIEIQSEEGEGTLVRVAFPRA